MKLNYSYLFLDRILPQSEEHFVSLVPGGEGGEEVLLLVHADLDRVGDDESRLFFGHSGNLGPSDGHVGFPSENVCIKAQVICRCIKTAVDQDVSLQCARIL